MKLSKRATGTLLLAVGAGVVGAQGVAIAAPATPGDVAGTEEALSTSTVPFAVPLDGATSRLGLLPQGTRLSGAIPSSPLMPPVPDANAQHQLIPDRIVPALNGGRVGPSLQAEAPLPAATDATQMGALGLDAPAAPVHLAGPAMELGHPLGLSPDHTGELANGALKVGELDPRVVTGPVQAIPGAKASLGSADKHLSVADSVGNLATTATATTGEVLGQTPLEDSADTDS